MRRRRPISVWPALADLMTVLAVVGLFLALSLLPAMEDKAHLIARLIEVEEQLEVLAAEHQQAREEWTAEREGLNREIREAVRNEEMFSAIQSAQRLVDEISSDQQLQFTADQTLQFGDDLVSFERNRYEPLWRPEGKRKLRRFCELLRERLEGQQYGEVDLYNLFTIHVEGHSDSTQCPGDPNCNWWLSGRRAAEFMRLMRDEYNCPGGGKFQLRPIAYADSKPYSSSSKEESKPVRRIALRIIPKYEVLLSSRRR